MLNDMRYSLRLLRRRPAFALGAISTLALAIGGTTAIATIGYGVFFRPSIVPEAERVLIVQQRDAREPQIRSAVDFPQYKDWRDTVTAFTSLAAVSSLRFDLTGGAAERVDGQAVTWNFFDTLGVPPAIGRTFTAADAGGRPAVISERLWRGRFAADPHVAGRAITASGFSFTVVGVMPAGFEHWRGETDLWVPIDAVAGRSPTSGGYVLYTVIGRLRPEATVAGAIAEATASVRRLASVWQDRFQASAISLREDVVAPDAKRLLALFTLAVVLVWVIACANVGGLILARTTDRLPEFAVRTALGATAGRLRRQMFAEAAALAVAGTAGGSLLATWGVELAVARSAVIAGRGDIVRFDGASVAAAALIALLTAMAVGLMPAAFLSKRLGRLVAVAGGRGTVALGTSRLHDVLVSLQIAVAVVVLASGGLVLRSLSNLRQVDLGFEPASVLTAGISIPSRSGPASVSETVASLLEQLRAVPGVRAAAVSWDLPVPNAGRTVSLTIENGPRFVNGEVSQRARTPGRHIVSPDYFAAFGIPIVRGRGFLGSDNARAQPVTIISAEMARLHWPGKDPVGQRVSNGFRRRDGSVDSPWLTIVGVAADARYGGPAAALRPQMYVPIMQSPNPNLFVVVQGAGDPLSLVSTVKQRIAAVDANIPVFDVAAMATRVDDAIADARTSSMVVSAFALVAVVLSVGGLFTAITGRVARRRRELAIRVALGADRAHLVRLVVRHAAALVVPATAIGVIAAAGATRLLQHELFGVSPGDPSTLAAAAAGLASLGLLGALLPARRAARVDPMIALRSE